MNTLEEISTKINSKMEIQHQALLDGDSDRFESLTRDLDRLSDIYNTVLQELAKSTNNG